MLTVHANQRPGRFMRFTRGDDCIEVRVSSVSGIDGNREVSLCVLDGTEKTIRLRSSEGPRIIAEDLSVCVAHVKTRDGKAAPLNYQFDSYTIEGNAFYWII